MLATGIDIIDVSRIDKGINKFGDRYVKKILGPDEIILLEARQDKSQFVAGRFAAKEAMIKALGEFLTDRPSLPALQVIYDQAGIPRFKLDKNLTERLAGHAISLSISHERSMAVAMVVIMEDR